MFIEIAQIIFGLLFFLYLPGYFIVELTFENSKKMEKFLLAVLFSIMLGLIIGVFFGYDRAQALRTGGFTENNIWVAELLLTALLVFSLAFKRKLQRSSFPLKTPRRTIRKRRVKKIQKKK